MVTNGLLEIRNRGESQLLHKAQVEWRETVDTIPDLIIVENMDGTIRRCNKAVCDFFKEPFSDLVGCSLSTLFHQCLSIPSHFIESGWLNGVFRVGVCEVQNLAANRWYEITNDSIVHRGSDVDGWVHIIKDITARKNAELEMKRLNAAIEQADDSILITNTQGLIEYINPSFEKLTDWRLEDLEGVHFLSLLSPSALTKYGTVNQAIEQAIEFEQVWRGSCVSRRRDGSIYQTEMTISPVRDENNKLLNFVVVERDVTEKSRLESIAEAINTMDNAGYIFSGIRHELGNPINSIKTALTVLKTDIDDLPLSRIIEFIDRALIEVGRVEYLLKTLKSFSMHENPQIQSLSLIMFFEKFLALIRNDFAKKGISINFLTECQVANCFADPRALHQVLINLITNAADALKEQVEATINISVRHLGSRIEIKVQDNGHGMDEKQIKNLFKPFYTSKPHGTGLGLVIVKKMITKMSGTIDVKSELGKNTEVILSLEAAID